MWPQRKVSITHDDILQVSYAEVAAGALAPR